MTTTSGLRSLALTTLALLACLTSVGRAQRIRDLTNDETLPVRLVGYGLVVGLDGTGDRGSGGRASGQTVQSVANLLRRFDIDVPPELLRTRNVAAVLVTAEASPYLRPGGRFEVHVSSVGDAQSLRGGVLWMTPLVSDVGGQPLATAQGNLLISEGGATVQMARHLRTVETTARIPTGGLVEADLPRPAFAASSRLLLKEPNLGTATRIAAAVDSALGAGTATVEDPGSVLLAVKDTGTARAVALARIRDLPVSAERVARVVIDGRDGTVVAGGDLTVGEAVVSHGAITLTIGGPAGAAGPAGPAGAASANAIRIPVGTSVQQVAAALHAVQSAPSEIAAIFAALREVGAIAAEVVVR